MKKKRSLRRKRRPVSKKNNKGEKTREKLTKEPRPTLKNRSLSMPGKQKPFKKWKKNPFLSRNDTVRNIKKIEDRENTLNNETYITTHTVSLNDIILPVKEEPFGSESVLEECEILLSSIRDDEFEDVQEDLQLPSGLKIPK